MCGWSLLLCFPSGYWILVTGQQTEQTTEHANRSQYTPWCLTSHKIQCAFADFDCIHPICIVYLFQTIHLRGNIFTFFFTNMYMCFSSHYSTVKTVLQCMSAIQPHIHERTPVARQQQLLLKGTSTWRSGHLWTESVRASIVFWPFPSGTREGGPAGRGAAGRSPGRTGTAADGLL